MGMGRENEEGKRSERRWKGRLEGEKYMSKEYIKRRGSKGGRRRGREDMGKGREGKGSGPPGV